MYAFTTVVLVRSNSGAFGITSCESEIGTPGIASRDELGEAQLVRGIHEREEQRDRDRLDALAREPRDRARARRLRRAAARPLPSKRMRSGTPSRRRRGTIGCGGGSRTSQMSSL